MGLRIPQNQNGWLLKAMHKKYINANKEYDMETNLS